MPSLKEVESLQILVRFVDCAPRAVAICSGEQLRAVQIAYGWHRRRLISSARPPWGKAAPHVARSRHDSCVWPAVGYS